MLHRASIYYKQVRLLMDVIPFVAKEEVFALKGGTAINLFVKDLPRLSVDIDLTYLPIEPRDESLKRISQAFERIAMDIERFLKGSKVYKIGKQDELLKLQVERFNVRIKIEASLVLRGTVKIPSLRIVTPKVEEEFGFVGMLVLHTDDLYAGKICAALDRQHPRDFFDIKGLLDSGGISEELMDVFIVYLISSNQSVSKLLAPNFIDLSEVFKRQFIGMTLERISLEEILEIRKKLVFTIHSKLKDRHKEFLISFKEGRPNWSLLPFEGIENLPSIKWKMLNLAKMESAKRKEAVKKLADVLKL
ncbi:MAG: nucleotidyl transferase AbiEii/AbiGii toxin family protein [Epsilonproteobacteria bacterium]|nr:nucleotidyl transferase AbiEii/AbiGii toxin family protein [Campylobacterota bacterium]